MGIPEFRLLRQLCINISRNLRSTITPAPPSLELFSNNDPEKRFTIQSVLNGFGGGSNDRLAIRNNLGTELVTIGE